MGGLTGCVDISAEVYGATSTQLREPGVIVVAGSSDPSHRVPAERAGTPAGRKNVVRVRPAQHGAVEEVR